MNFKSLCHKKNFTRFVVAFFFLFLFSFVNAQDKTVYEQVMSNLLNIEDWITNFRAALAEYAEVLRRISYSLAVAGFVAGILGAMFTSTAALSSVFRRLIMAGIILSITPVLTQASLAAWDNLRLYSGQQLQASFAANHTKYADFARIAEELLVLTHMVGMDNFNSEELGRAVESSNKNEVVRVGFAVQASGMILSISTMGLMLLLILTGLAIQLSGLFLPLAAGFLLFDEQAGKGWLSSFFRAVGNSLSLVIILPIAFNFFFGLVIDTTMDWGLTMIRQTLVEAQVSLQESQRILLEIDDLTEQNLNLSEVYEQVAEAHENAANQLTNQASYIPSETTSNRTVNQQTAINFYDQLYAQLASIGQAKEVVTQKLEDAGSYLRRQTLGRLNALSTAAYRLLTMILMLVVFSIMSFFALFMIEKTISQIWSGLSIRALAATAATSSWLMNRATGMARGVAKAPSTASQMRQSAMRRDRTNSYFRDKNSRQQAAISQGMRSGYNSLATPVQNGLRRQRINHLRSLGYEGRKQQGLSITSPTSS